MKTVHEIVNSLSQNEWSYYNTDKRLTDEVLHNKETALKFIEDYFHLAGKEKVFKFPAYDQNKELVLNRAPHIISTFVLGLKIAECLGIITGERDESGFSFQYRWFLTCLYHDIGYIYEKKTVCEWLRMTASDGIKAIQAVCNIQYLHNRVFKTYPREIVDIYLKGRAKCSDGRVGVLDHGIVGGLLLYDDSGNNLNDLGEKEQIKLIVVEKIFMLTLMEDVCIVQIHILMNMLKLRMQ